MIYRPARIGDPAVIGLPHYGTWRLLVSTDAPALCRVAAWDAAGHLNFYDDRFGVPARGQRLHTLAAGTRGVRVDLVTGELPVGVLVY